MMNMFMWRVCSKLTNMSKRPDGFFQKQLNEDDLQYGLHQVEYPVHDVKPAGDILHSITWEDANGDGEAGVDDDKHGAQLEQEAVHQRWLWVTLLNQPLDAVQTIEDGADAVAVGD